MKENEKNYFEIDTHLSLLLLAVGMGVGTLGGGTGMAFRLPAFGFWWTVGVTRPVGAIRPAVRGRSVRTSIANLEKKKNPKLIAPLTKKLTQSV